MYITCHLGGSEKLVSNFLVLESVRKHGYGRIPPSTGMGEYHPVRVWVETTHSY